MANTGQPAASLESNLRHPPQPTPTSKQVRIRQLDEDVHYRVIARGTGASPADDAAALADYFNLSHSLSALAPGWTAACPRYAAVAPHLPGARMLRQDPVECLFQVWVCVEVWGWLGSLWCDAMVRGDELCHYSLPLFIAMQTPLCPLPPPFLPSFSARPTITSPGWVHALVGPG